MNFAAKVMRLTVRRVLVIQLLIVMGVALAYLLADGLHSAQSALYGGMIALISTWSMAWRITKAAETAAEDSNQGAFVIYAGAVQRFVFTLAMMALGMGFLGLAPLAILAGYAAAQLAYTFNKVDTRLKT